MEGIIFRHETGEQGMVEVKHFLMCYQFLPTPSSLEMSEHVLLQ